MRQFSFGIILMLVVTLAFAAIGHIDREAEPKAAKNNLKNQKVKSVGRIEHDVGVCGM